MILLLAFIVPVGFVILFYFIFIHRFIHTQTKNILHLTPAALITVAMIQYEDQPLLKMSLRQKKLQILVKTGGTKKKNQKTT